MDWGQHISPIEFMDDWIGYISCICKEENHYTFYQKGDNLQDVNFKLEF